MKSEYYVATVVNAYRRAIDEYYKTGYIPDAALYNGELERITHRVTQRLTFWGITKNDIL